MKKIANADRARPEGRRTNSATLKSTAIRVLSALLVCAAAGTPGAAQPAQPNAVISVDFDKSRGPLLRTERYNNLTRAHRWVEQRDADVDFYNEQGLHGKIYRVWVIVEDIHDPQTGRYNYEGMDDYLTDVSRLSDELLVVLDTRASIGKLRRTPAEIKPLIKTIMRDLKQRHPQIKYIEAFNEPDHNLRDVIRPEQLYDYYSVYYQAVNEVNRELKPKVPLLVGGPATGSCGSPWAPLGPNNMQWIPKFLDAYAADPDPGKRLDFLSYHAYGYFKNQANCSEYTPIRADPSQLAGQRARTEEELRKRGLDVNIPSFITETGGYPGPSYDNKQDPHPDYLRQAAIMASYMYWYLENPRDVPFNWVLRHAMEERKDQLLTRAGEGKPIPTRTFTPYGNQMLMFSKLKDERVAAQSNALANGKGVYAIATKDKTGAAVVVWNYQQAAAEPYRVTINMDQLPANLRNKRLRQRMFRIDDKVSNYWGDPAHANLQQVSESVIKPGNGHSVTVDLTANALQLVVLEPAR
ncbi:glycosyl hydrolase [Phenylobacterium sp. LjRoot225]|uniref:glycosyl hydrolase n=1 Tax=Phenylobacterium sp. LjRoot225 TaxID=3342285 RepID=UPI003ECD656E